jgi:hypothetical protein
MTKIQLGPLIEKIEPSHPEPSKVKAHCKMRACLAEIVGDLWTPTFQRLEGPYADPEVAFSLCGWLISTADAYERDVEYTTSAEWREVASARAFVLRRSATKLIKIIEQASGQKAPPEIINPPRPEPLWQPNPEQKEAFVPRYNRTRVVARFNVGRENLSFDGPVKPPV